MWNFGDGATAEGQRVQHTYPYPGSYVVELQIAYNYSDALTRLTVTTTQPAVTLTEEADGSLTIFNKSSDDLDVGGWALTDGAHTFMIPADTMVLAGGGVRFAPGVTGVEGSLSAALLYSNGARAAGASPSMDSPLRGVQVAPEKLVSRTPSSSADADIGASAQQVSPAPAQTQNTDNQPGLSAAVAQSPASGALPLWLSITGLLVLVALGGGAVWYLQTYQAAVPAGSAKTSTPEEEFEIE
jgi:PKD repeat protein